MSGPVSDLQTNSPDNSTLVISWRPPTIPNGEIIGYTIRIENLRDGTTMNHNTAMTSLTESDLGTLFYTYFNITTPPIGWVLYYLLLFQAIITYSNNNNNYRNRIITIILYSCWSSISC